MSKSVVMNWLILASAFVSIGISIYFQDVLYLILAVCFILLHDSNSKSQVIVVLGNREEGSDV